MKIINRGTNPATTPLYATCNKCETQIEFLPHEARYISDQRDGDCYLIACPVCSANIYKSRPTAYSGPYG